MTGCRPQRSSPTTVSCPGRSTWPSRTTSPTPSSPMRSRRRSVADAAWPPPPLPCAWPPAPLPMTCSVRCGSSRGRSSMPDSRSRIPASRPSSTTRCTDRNPMDQLQSRLLQALTHLPEPIIQRLAGRPIRRGERHLAPEAHLILTLAKVTREKPLDAVPLAKARRSLDRTTTLLAAEHPIGAVRDFTIAGRPARLYTPAARLGAEASPTMLYFHGGFH